MKKKNYILQKSSKLTEKYKDFIKKNFWNRTKEMQEKLDNALKNI